MLTMNSDVLDDCDVAYEMEERERNAGIQKILDNVKRNEVKETDLDPELRCDLCNSFIPIERQRIVLSMADSCDYCVCCQDYIDKKDRNYA